MWTGPPCWVWVLGGGAFWKLKWRLRAAWLSPAGSRHPQSPVGGTWGALPLMHLLVGRKARPLAAGLGVGRQAAASSPRSFSWCLLCAAWSSPQRPLLRQKRGERCQAANQQRSPEEFLFWGAGGPHRILSELSSFILAGIAHLSQKDLECPGPLPIPIRDGRRSLNRASGPWSISPRSPADNEAAMCPAVACQKLPSPQLQPRRRCSHAQCGIPP